MRRIGTATRSTAVVAAAPALLLLFSGNLARAGDAPAATAARDLVDPWELAERIDQRLAAAWKAAGIQPAPLADDAEFLRRVYLDLSGRIPSVGEARAFFDDPSPSKRRALIDRLLNRASFAAHFATTLRTLLLPTATNDPQMRQVVRPFEIWLRLRLADNTPYNRLAAELLTAPLGSEMAAGRRMPIGPGAFYAVNERKPENLAANASRVFLGVQVQCAQCHDHPFREWSRGDFWSLAAFFVEAAPLAPDRPAMMPVAARRGIEIPGTGKRVPPRFLGSPAPLPESEPASRAVLARWVASPDNPYFARAAANRLWAHLLGYGLIEPVDDFSAGNGPSHPEVLSELARQFAGHKFDLKYLCRAITATRAYQCKSAGAVPGTTEARPFAQMPARGMTAEQIFASLVVATGLEVGDQGNRGPMDLLDADSPREKFLSRFADTAPRTASQTSILQALTFMNGTLVAEATSLTKGATLRATLDAPFFDDAGRLESLFLAAYSRRPSQAETAALLALLQKAKSRSEREAVFADIFWAMLNSSEFAVVP